MNFDHNKHINNGTRVLNVEHEPHAYVAYAEATAGPWGVTCKRGRRGFDGALGLHDHEPVFTVKGPLINGPQSYNKVTYEVSERPSLLDHLLDELDGWDYVELSDEEYHTPRDD